jgi:gamma-glutamylcyclotransferase
MNDPKDIATFQEYAIDDDAPGFTALYFGYGSNMSHRTMKQRCPGSLYVGLGRLDDYKWAINSTGYANIVPSPGDVVYGSLCFLSSKDEASLDESEGVPWLYEKHYLSVTRLLGHGATGRTINALAYVDVQRADEGSVKPEYVIWINKAIQDASRDGLPDAYVSKYIRNYVSPPVEEPEIVMVRYMKPWEPLPGHWSSA